MNDILLSDLPPTARASADDVLYILSGSENRSSKITLGNMYRTIANMVMFAWCEYCGQKNKQEREYCWACGGRLPTIQEPESEDKGE